MCPFLSTGRRQHIHPVSPRTCAPKYSDECLHTLYPSLLGVFAGALVRGCSPPVCLRCGTATCVSLG